nr:MAG: rep protein [Cressdnaviricota sp.]
MTLGQMVSYYKLQLYDDPMTTKELYKPDVKVYYFWGDSGVGKTKMVYDQIIELGYGDQVIDRVKYAEPFWFGQIYGKSPIVWFEEFRDCIMKACEFVAFIDYYVNPMRVIGGSRMNKYKYIFITSVQDPTTIYQNSKEPIQQWVRRMKVKHVVSLESN